MGQLTLNITEESDVKVIASSAFNFRVELVLQIGHDDLNDIFDISRDLADIFDNNFLLDENNVHKYFNSKTLPFFARYKGKVIGYIIGIPIENFKSESWVRYDNNFGENNTLYTYAYIMKKKYRKMGGYSRTLKRIYINWAKKQNYKFVSGHVARSVAYDPARPTLAVFFPGETHGGYYRGAG